MKKKIKSILLIAVCAIMASCNALDLANPDGYADGNFWKNEAQVSGYITGMHTQLRSNADKFFVMGEQRGGLLMSSGTFGTGMDNVTITMHNLKQGNAPYGNWGDFYGNILNFNMLISKLEGGLSFLSKEKTDYYLGQAHGMRAWYYFYLLRTWGGVPLVTEPKIANGTTDVIELQTARSTEEEIMNFLKQEITASETCFANDNFTLSAKRDLWSKAATLMLKSEIYLWAAKVYGTDATNDLQTAMTALQAIKSAGKFELLPNFSDVFTYTNKGNKEIIMALHYEKGEAEQSMRRFVYDIPMMANWYDKDGTPMKDPLNVGDKCILATEWKWDFFTSFSDDDSRKVATFLDFYSQDKKSNGVVLRKFLGMEDNKIRYYSDDMPLYRYADLILLTAEIKNKLGIDPSSEINEIRERACGQGNYEVYANGSFAENELAILHERDKEFVREGKRWFDVRRMQDASGKSLAFTEGGLKETEAYKLLWPIDTGTMTKDDLIKQNPVYGTGDEK